MYFPWTDNQPDGVTGVGDYSSCVWSSFNQGWKWEDQDCAIESFSICDNCNSYLNKYSIVYQSDSRNQSDARLLCQNEWGTDLASIHSEQDLEEALFLCDLKTSTDNIVGQEKCWIGLEYDDTNDAFKWIDGTDFDYGSPVNGDYQYPWNDGLA